MLQKKNMIGTFLRTKPLYVLFIEVYFHELRSYVYLYIHKYHLTDFQYTTQTYVYKVYMITL